MAIRPPSWCADAIPTDRGWTHPHTGELLKAVKIKPHMIDEWHANQNVEEVQAAPVAVEIQPVVEDTDEYNIDEGLPEIIVDETIFEDLKEVLEEEIMANTQMEMLTEAPANNKSLEEMTKRELEELGRQHGVELDRRKNKKTLVERMKSILD
jgi:hypothetical protein